MKVLSLEFFKLRRKWIFVMITLFLGAEILWTFISVGMSIARHPDSTGWEALLVTLASMNGLFFPIISAIVVSRICDMEHKGSTWKLLIPASVKLKDIYAAKYVCACILMLYAVVLQVIAITIFGITNSFSSPVPLSWLLQFIVGTMFTNMTILALQQWVSLSVKNQAFALCLGMLGGFIGMTADLFPTVISRIFIWSYYTKLCPVTYHYINNSAKYITQHLRLGTLTVVFLTGIIFYIAGNLQVSRQEM
ncbi:hypothetical protein CLPU_4c00940 [Gottschalkia purinilytica]|uniref:ABC-2 family transporter protein n=1 Tax=Gottschalkia purinilytica TaxID=1503 RepID=A0A0L0WC50_GOTPU|nr:ABC transporter permease [Gottschalkia purinilytica]KNF09048.1 hypothetical protein CLPU_4c00940 [Gottschalkia purinilytica]